MPSRSVFILVFHLQDAEMLPLEFFDILLLQFDWLISRFLSIILFQQQQQ